MAEEYLPTPYTTEEIRDAWVEGFEVTTRTRSAVGEMLTLTRVVAWSEVGFGMVEIELDAQGRPMEGEPDTVVPGSSYGITRSLLSPPPLVPAPSGTRLSVDSRDGCTGSKARRA
jgi:hypothetical protein